MKVFVGDAFKKDFQNFPNADKDKISEFIEYVQNNGLVGLTGRNKSSDDVPKDDPFWSNKVRYAQKYQLWHYHIGIPNYELSESGDFVSEYVLHYIKGNDFIKIVDMNGHPPFTLPTENYLS